ncbi:hypothetical protein HDK77DRAFT_431247 [Phyllosticta capitalensis]
MSPSSTPTSNQRQDPLEDARTSQPSCYGYHNTFHTHSLPQDPNATPPTYASSLQDSDSNPGSDHLPPYSCAIEFQGPLAFKAELINIFEPACSKLANWTEVYVVLRGTMLSIYRLKHQFFSKGSKKPLPGRLIKTYSLQHAEVGLALDFKKTDLIPRSPLAKLIPPSARQSLFETDPHLFWPIREHVIRLRLETEQLLFCSREQANMLDWVEQICTAVDISQPLDVRSEPRYRSIPRRGRRQRQLDGSNGTPSARPRSENIDVSARRLLAEQERIIRTMYPNLALESVLEEQPAPAPARESDNEMDPADLLLPPTTAQVPLARSETEVTASSEQPTFADGVTDVTSVTGTSRPSFDDGARPDANDKLATAEPSASSLLRYRKRCAPVLMQNSPRASDVVFHGGRRLRINSRRQTVSYYSELPPHYTAHHFTADQRDFALNQPLRRQSVRREMSGESVRPFSVHVESDGNYSAYLTPVTSNSTQRNTITETELFGSRRGENPSDPPSPIRTRPAPAAAQAPQLKKIESEGEREHQQKQSNRRSRLFFGRAKAPLTGVAEAFGGLVI